MKKTAIILSILVSLLIINNLLRSIYGLWQKHDLLTLAQNDLDEKKREQSMLEKQLAQVKNPQFVEEQARDKLFLVKPGEEIVLMKKPTPAVTPIPVQKSDKAHWQEWLSLFLNGTTP